MRNFSELREGLFSFGGITDEFGEGDFGLLEIGSRSYCLCQLPQKRYSSIIEFCG
jgi:hypothetical protein